MYGKYVVTTTFFNHNHTVTVSNLNEVPLVMYQLLLRQTVVNSGLVSALPWEEHLKTALGGSIPGIPEKARVDSDVLINIRGSREVALAAVRDCTTYDAMARELRLARDAVRAIDPYFYLEEDFFTREVPGIVEKLILNKVLGTLPGSEPRANDSGLFAAEAEAAYKEIAGINASTIVRHSLPVVGKAVCGAMMILRGIIDSESLVAKAVSANSDFHKAVYNKCANFLVFDGKPGSASSSSDGPLRGFAAMQAFLKQLNDPLAAGKSIDLSSLKVFRQFRWLLSPEEDARVQKLIVEERRKRQNSLESHMIKDGLVAVEEPSAASAGAEAATSLSLAVVAAEPKVTVAKKASIASAKGTSPSLVEQPPTKRAKAAVDDLENKMALFLPRLMASKQVPNSRTE